MVCCDPGTQRDTHHTRLFLLVFCLSLVLPVSVTRPHVHVGVSYPSFKFFMLFWLQYWRIECRTLYLLDGHSMLFFPLVEQWAEV